MYIFYLYEIFLTRTKCQTKQNMHETAIYIYKHELCSNSKLDTNHANRTRKTFRGLESSTTVLTLLCTGIKLLKETSSNVCKYQIKYFIFFYLSLGVNSGKSTFNLDL